ncbi:MAG: DUF3078 domain-containing protein [Bacteroidota bacterium]
MKLSYLLLILFSLTISTNSYSQKKKPIIPIIVALKPVTTTVITPKYTVRAAYFRLSNWENKNIIGFDLNEIAFMNWSAGGTSSISGLLKGDFTRIRTTENTKWVNELIVRYGINKQDGFAIRKSDDELRFNSTLGYRKNESSNWYHSAKFNFNTQFTNGYKYPDTDHPISKPFAPAYTFLGAGADYYDKAKKLDIYISPLTFKNTLVLDQTLANKGSFGVTKATYDSEGNLISKGKLSKTEMGFLITNYYKKEVWKNITMENRLSLYSDYLNNFGNIDVDWKLQFDLVVNKYVSANIGTHILYDDDVKTTEEINGETVIKGPKLQLKQSLGIGMVYAF